MIFNNILAFASVLLAVLQCEQDESSLSHELNKLWSDHKIEHDLNFDHHEETRRRQIFQENHDYIQKANKKNLGYTLEHNRFSHMTHEEFLQFLGSQSKPTRYVLQSKPEIKPLSYKPKGVDWRERGAVTPVKDQKRCGSCWAHATVESAESAYYIKYNKTVIFSPQNIMDCSWEYGNRGCSGGLSNWAFKFMIDEGVNTEAEYPYEAKDGKCRMKRDADSEVYKLKSHEYLTPMDEDMLARVVEERGPVAVGIDASSEGFRFYRHGIYYSPKCSQTEQDHAVVLVGMGLEPEPHYILRNSWSELWGDEGFFRFPFNGTNPCGVASDTNIPIF